MVRTLVVLVTALAASACTIAPYKKPLDAEMRVKLAQPVVYSRADDRGIGVQYFAQDSSAAGAPYGLIGALVTATMDAIANSTPLGIAEDGATRLTATFDHGQTTGVFNDLLSSRLRTVSLFAETPVVHALDKERKWTAASFQEDVVLVSSLQYSLSQDLRSFEVALETTALHDPTRATGASAKGKSARSKTDGVIYRNRFEYHSAPLADMPGKSPEEIAAALDGKPTIARDAVPLTKAESRLSAAQRGRGTFARDRGAPRRATIA